MKNLFEHTSAPWIRYSGYEYKTDSNNDLYITVSKGTKPEMYRPAGSRATCHGCGKCRACRHA